MIWFVNPFFNKYTYTETTFDLKVPLLWGPVCTHKTGVSYQSCWKLTRNNSIKTVRLDKPVCEMVSRDPLGRRLDVIWSRCDCPCYSWEKHTTSEDCCNWKYTNKMKDVPVLKFSPYSLPDKHCMLTVYFSSPHYVFNSITHMDTF